MSAVGALGAVDAPAAVAESVATTSVADLPSAADWYSAASREGRSAIIFVSDEAGGAVPAFTDGVNWRRVTDRNIVS